MGIVDILIGPVTKILDKVIPDPAQRDQAKLAVLKLQQDGELDTLKTEMSAILAEEQSADPWTSRARPTFLYVMYIMILLSVPVGLVSVFSPGAATAFAVGMTGFLKAIPDSLYALFGTGYLGYTAARQWGKIKGSDK